MTDGSKKKVGLGRGLSALLSSVENDEQSNLFHSETKSITFIPIEQIENNPFQPRKKFDEDSIKELAESIRSFGIIQPITVRQINNNKYQLISGERRILASKIVGLKNIPAFIVDISDDEMLFLALIENIQRKDLNPIEIAISYQKLIDDFGLTQEELSEKIGVNRTTITNFLRLLKLDEETKKELIDENITAGHARALLAIEDINIRQTLLRKIISQNLSVRETEKMINQLKNDQLNKIPRILRTQAPEHVIQRIDQLSKYLGTKVEIRISSKGTGTLIIPFSSEIQLEKIMELLNSSK